MQDIHKAKNTLFVRKVTFKESEIVSSKSDSDVGYTDFPDIEELSLQQKPIETAVREQITESQTVPSDPALSQESFLQQLKQ